MIDLKKLEESLSDEQIIEMVTDLGSDEYKITDNAIIFKTICHNHDAEDASMKLYYYKNSHRFVCYTDCGDSFNIYELFKRRYETLGITYNFYTDIVLKITKGKTDFSTNNFGEKYESIQDKFQEHTITVNIPEIPSHLLNIFKFYPTYEWLSDGISPESMKRYNILYSRSQNKIIIPHYDENNRLIGIRGRALNEEDIKMGKYMPIQIENTFYAHPLGYNLYGLNMNKENIKRKKTAIVVEGEKSCLLFDTYYGQSNNISVAVCGNSLSYYQTKLLRAAGAETVIIAFDNPSNLNNYKEKELQFSKLTKMCKKYSNYFKMGFIIDRKGLLSEKDSPVDKGKTIFEQLLKCVQWI